MRDNFNPEAKNNKQPQVVTSENIDTETNGLFLHKEANGNLAVIDKSNNCKPVSIDFANYKQKINNNQLLQASKLKKHPTWSLCDTTAGMGQDAFVLACYAKKVVALERHPIIFALLEDALFRAKNLGDGFIDLASKKITLHNVDARIYLKTSEMFDVVYLDPMFSGVKAKAKKSMQLLRDLLPEPTDSDELLNVALSKARHKVIVKRHKKSPFLNNKKPDIQYFGKSHRFDVYVVVQPKILASIVAAI